MTLNEVFEKPEALFTEYFFHFADFPFHFAGDLFCCATVLQIAVSNGFSDLFFNLARNLPCRPLYFVCCA
jgi:hypothetical protein